MPTPVRFWHSLRFRGAAYQVAALVLALAVAGYMANNAIRAMAQRGIHTGFGFLFRQAGFNIGETLFPFSSTDTFLRAFATGLANTLWVSAVSLVGATVLGSLIGVARLSSNWLLARIASIYVELFRNTPQLVQIVLWYTLITHLPGAREAWHVSDWLYLSNRGLITAWPADHLLPLWIAIGLLAAFGLSAAWSRWVASKQLGSGRSRPLFAANVGIIIVIPVMIWLFAGTPTSMDVPKLGAFNFRGGLTLSPEFLALALGLILYIAAYIAEIVRSGIQSVGRGQIEAGQSIGLRRLDLYRWVIVPHALRVVVPPITAQYISLIKTSSLGVAIGYPELFNVTNSIITLSGHTIECVLIMGAVYLVVALGISALMNLGNRAVALKEH